MEYQLDFYKGFLLACNNARAHLEAAKVLTQINYGIANAHLVLAAEEGIKGYAIYDKLKGGHLYQERFDEFFWSHKYKHQSIWELENIFAVLFKELGALLRYFYIHMDQYVKGAQVPEHRKKELLECIVDLEKEDPDFNKLKEWCSKADNYKMAGFYLDINVDKAEWLEPKNITKEEYEESYQIVTQWLDSIFSIAKSLKEENLE